LRGLAWPDHFTARVLQNDFVREWAGRETELYAVAESQRNDYLAALAAGDPERVGVHVGECIGLIHDVPSAREIVEQTVAHALRILRENAARVQD
jgi:nitronate monooxygenase